MVSDFETPRKRDVDARANHDTYTNFVHQTASVSKPANLKGPENAGKKNELANNPHRFH